MLERAGDAEIILVSKVKLTEAVIAALPQLRYISMLATGYNNVDVAAAARRGIPVSNVPAYSTESVVQTAFALLLELTTRVGLHDAAVKAGEWVRCPDHAFWKSSIVELDGLTMGIVGYGTIGRAMARVAAAFGMKVIAHAPRIPAIRARCRSALSLWMNFLPLPMWCRSTVPRPPRTPALSMPALLSLMKPGAFFLNVARGGLVNEADLAEALNPGLLPAPALM